MPRPNTGTGYACRKCGYEPDYNELNEGSCPECRRIEREERGEPEPKTLPSLLHTSELHTMLRALYMACVAVEDDAKDTEPGERVKVTGATVGKVQKALNLVEERVVESTIEQWRASARRSP